MEDFKWNSLMEKFVSNFDIDGYTREDCDNNRDLPHPKVHPDLSSDLSTLLIELTNVAPKETKKPSTNTQAGQQHTSSLLTKKDHSQFVNNVLDLYLTQGHIPHACQWKYRKNAAKVAKEQQKYSEYALQTAVNNLDFYNYLQKHVIQFSKDKQAYDTKKIPDAKYFFKDLYNFQLVPFLNDPVPVCTNVILQQDNLVTVVKPIGGNCVAKYKFEEPEQTGSMEEDPNLKILLKKWKPNIVLSMKTLKILAANHEPFSNEWEIPFSVEEYTSEDDIKRSVVYFKKSLPSKSLTAREMNLNYYKKALKSWLRKFTKPETSPVIIDDEGSEPHHEQNEDSEPKLEIELSSIKTESEEKQIDLTLETTSMENAQEAESIQSTVAQETNEASLSEFSSVSDGEEGAKEPSNFAKDLIEVVDKVKDNDDDDESLLTVDDDDIPIPQFDGASDKKAKTARKSIKQSAANSKTTNKGQAEKLNEPEKSNNTPSRSDIWKKSLATEEKVTSFTTLSSKPTRKSSVSHLMGPWQSKISQPAVKVPQTDGDDSDENRLVLDIDETSEKEPIAKSQLSQEDNDSDQTELTFGVANDPEIAKQIKALASDGQTKKTKPIIERKMLTRSTSKCFVASPKLKVKITPKSKKQRSSTQSIEAKEKNSESDRVLPQNTAEKKDFPSSSNVEAQKTSESKAPVVAATTSKAPRVTKTPHNISFPSVAATHLATVKSSQPVRQLKRKASFMAMEKQQPAPTEQKDEKRRIMEQDSLRQPPTFDLLGDILEMQKKPETQKSNFSRSQDEPMQSFDDLLTQREIHQNGKPQFYSLWTFGETRVLIKGSLHAEMLIKKNHVETKMFTTIKAKLEYQSNLGLEQLTWNEVCSDWIDLKFHPQPSTILRCRVSPHDQNVCGTDIITDLTTYNATMKRVNFSPLKPKKHLLTLFAKVSNPRQFSPGEYLMSHRSGENSYLVRQKVNQNAGKHVLYDLKQEYQFPGRFVVTTAENFVYVPLDPHRQTSSQRRKKIAPMTFWPPLKHDSPDAQSFLPKRKKKKGKNKNKKSESRGRLSIFLLFSQ